MKVNHNCWNVEGNEQQINIFGIHMLYCLWFVYFTTWPPCFSVGVICTQRKPFIMHANFCKQMLVIGANVGNICMIRRGVLCLGYTLAKQKSVVRHTFNKVDYIL